jgi:hypothetical protein
MLTELAGSMKLLVHPSILGRKWSILIRSSITILYAFLISLMSATCPTFLIFLDLLFLIIFGAYGVLGCDAV